VLSLCINNNVPFPTKKKAFNGVMSFNLIDLSCCADDTILFDIKYATSENFVNVAVYNSSRAILRRPAADALLRASSRMQAKGFGIKVYDGYRPLSVTKMFWDLTPPNLREFVANPVEGSKHNRGCAVDLTFYKLDNPNETILMPSDFDEFNETAHSDYNGLENLDGDALVKQNEALNNRNFLISIMEEGGEWTVQYNEWWHFNLKDWESYDILDIPFEDISTNVSDPEHMDS